MVPHYHRSGRKQSSMPGTYVKRILEAQVYGAAMETPIHAMPALSRETGNRVLVKREDLQPVFSFKIRGAYNKIMRLPDARLRRGVVTASAGNHAQGVALAASRRGVRAIIVMPVTTPQIKIAAVRSHGADVVLRGDRFDDARLYALSLAADRRLEFIHPYDDPDIIAGQGTIGMEILRQHQGSLDAVFLPVGGGGLAAGVATYIRYLRPSVRILAVESETSACLMAAMRAGRRVRLPHVGIFADGVAVAQVGAEPFRLLRHCIDGIITVSDDEICAAIKDLFDDTRSVAEPAGAVGLAGLKKYAARRKLRDRTLLTIESGANVNFDTLRYISERADIGEKREVIVAATMPDRPGSLRAFCSHLRGCDVTLFNYRYAGPGRAHVLLGVEPAPGSDVRAALLPALRKAGCSLTELSDNELAKMHVSHMIGGKAGDVAKELTFEVEMPERPGILRHFLDTLSDRWNITIFHYRKQGGAYARVFIGFDVSGGGADEIRARLAAMKFRYEEETHNSAYRLFLR